MSSISEKSLVIGTEVVTDQDTKPVQRHSSSQYSNYRREDKGSKSKIFSMLLGYFPSPFNKTNHMMKQKNNTDSTKTHAGFQNMKNESKQSGISRRK
mmetsp:Transcript_24924/g.40166  ORF Transcript_24924/g.40166 Transcript_24924/m.40166 type:complete len:97 (+) Transcript_24924:521-811(+)